MTCIEEFLLKDNKPSTVPFILSLSLVLELIEVQ